MATPRLKMKTFDMTPTWVGLMPALFAVLENGTELGKKMAREELMDLARKVDAINARTGDRP